MSKYDSKSVYGTLFMMLENLSEENQKYLMENVFDNDFLDAVKNNPSKAYDVLNDVVINIEDGKQDKVSKLLADYKDKIYMMKNMLKNYGGFKMIREGKINADGLDKKNRQFYDFLIQNDFEITKCKENHDDVVWFIKDVDGFELNFRIAKSNGKADKAIDLFLDFYESKKSN